MTSLITVPNAAYDARFGAATARNNWWNQGVDTRYDFPFEATGNLTGGQFETLTYPAGGVQPLLPAPGYRPACQSQYRNPALNFLSFNPYGCSQVNCPRPTVKFATECGCGCAVVAPTPSPGPGPGPTPVPVPIPGSRIERCDRAQAGQVVCPQIYMPACGCTVESVTGNVARVTCRNYSNQCEACADPRNTFTYTGQCGVPDGRLY